MGCHCVSRNYNLVYMRVFACLSQASVHAVVCMGGAGHLFPPEEFETTSLNGQAVNSHECHSRTISVFIDVCAAGWYLLRRN